MGLHSGEFKSGECRRLIVVNLMFMVVMILGCSEWLYKSSRC